jgi:SAM-dependent methyltransferase
MFNFYFGSNAENYDKIRSQNPKWQFEDEKMIECLNLIQGKIRTVLDLPIGTGRSLKNLEKFPQLAITGVDISKDMLNQAEKNIKGKLNEKVELVESNLFDKELNRKWDLVISYRFLNLLNWDDASTALKLLSQYARRYLLITIRTVSEDKKQDILEDKIHLHDHENFMNLMINLNCKPIFQHYFPDNKGGEYYVMLFQKTDQYDEIRINKNRNFTYFRNIGLSKEKVYEAANPVHAKWIKYVTELEELRHNFPRVKSINHHFLNVEWVDGLTMNQEHLEIMASLDKKIKMIQVKESSHFDYIEDLVLPRFAKTIPIIGLETFQRVIEIIETYSKKASSFITHPDLTMANLILKDGELVSIDNELLCKTHHPIISLLNSLYNLEEADGEEYFRFYSKDLQEDEKLALEDKEYLKSLWFARQVGSLLIQNKIDDVYKYRENYEQLNLIYPLSIFRGNI